jgi:hypothetical protein
MPREKASLHEGHGFSRAIKGLPTTALAAEVRFSTHTRQRHLSAVVFAADDWERRTSEAKALIRRVRCGTVENDLSAVFITWGEPEAHAARLNPCPSLINATRKNLLSFRQQPINETNLILFGQALLKAINTLHCQKIS